MITHGSLFSGIGGFDLGFQWANIKMLWDVEIEPYCQKVLRKNFPDTEIFSDVREVGKHNLKPVDIISGGFPCQDISVAGKQAGITGTRSGLWSEFHRIIGELLPRFAVIENVPNLARLGLDRVLTNLASIGYDAEWQCISANDIGAPHLRKRIWIVAYPESSQQQREACNDRGPGWTGNNKVSCPEAWSDDRTRPSINIIHINMDGLPYPMDASKGLGNAIVPQIAEIIGRRLVELLQYKKAA